MFMYLSTTHTYMDIQRYIYVTRCPHAERIKEYLGVPNLDYKTKVIYSKQIKQRLNELINRNKNEKYIKSI